MIIYNRIKKALDHPNHPEARNRKAQNQCGTAMLNLNSVREKYIPLDLLLGFFFKMNSRSHPKDTEAISGVGPYSFSSSACQPT